IFTDSDGHYVFPTPGLGEYSIKFTKQHYIESKKSLSILEGHGDVFVDDAYLSLKDIVVTRVTYQGGVAINYDGSVELSFPQDILDDDINTCITNFNDPEDLPADLPSDAAFTYCTDVEPYGTTLSDSAFVDQLNNRGFAPGTPIPLGSYNKQTFEWESEGLGNISPDG
ncbi:MAG: hypothetical protein GY861_03900, partial [bacterium]|nr:hypothetical protein [bacterium]